MSLNQGQRHSSTSPRLPTELIESILTDVWIETVNSQERRTLYDALASINPLFHQIAARLPPVLTMKDQDDYALQKRKTMDAVDLDSDSLGAQRLTISAAAPATARCHRRACVYLTRDSSASDFDEVEQLIGDCRSLTVRVMPSRAHSLHFVDGSMQLNLYKLIASFPSLTHLHLDYDTMSHEGRKRFPAPLPSVTSLRMLLGVTCTIGPLEDILVAFPNLEQLHTSGFRLTDLKRRLPPRLRILVMDLPRWQMENVNWNLARCAIGGALRRGLFAKPAETSIVLRSTEPLEFWWPETRRACAEFGVQVWQEKMSVG